MANTKAFEKVDTGIRLPAGYDIVYLGTCYAIAKDDKVLRDGFCIAVDAVYYAWKLSRVGVLDGKEQ
jgi:lipocalin